MKKRQSEKLHTNFDIIRKLEMPTFANLVFNVAKYECQTLDDFENFLSRDITAQNDEALQAILQSTQSAASREWEAYMGKKQEPKVRIDCHGSKGTMISFDGHKTFGIYKFSFSTEVDENGNHTDTISLEADAIPFIDSLNLSPVETEDTL